MVRKEQKPMTTDLTFDFLMRGFFGGGEFGVCHSDLSFCCRIRHKNPCFISCNLFTQKVWLACHMIQQFLGNEQTILLQLVANSCQTTFGHIFLVLEVSAMIRSIRGFWY